METASQKLRRIEARTACESLLNRVFVPIERNGVFGTHDGMVYRRDRTSGAIRRAIPKVRGKAARRGDKRARRQSARSKAA